MSDFEDIAHKTVAELFDMLKEKQYTADALIEINHEKQQEIDNLKAEIKKLRNLVGQAGCDIDAHQEGINQLKTQLAVYKEDMQRDANQAFLNKLMTVA